MELLRTCKITGKTTVSCIIQGSDDVMVQNGARAGRYEIPETLYQEYLSVLHNSMPSLSGTQKEKHVQVHTNTDLRNNLRNKSKNCNFMTKCFNCGQRGHISTKYTKTRMECTLCKLLGHVENNCSKNRYQNQNGKSKPILNVNSLRNNRYVCYFIDCMVNSHVLWGYVDSSSSAVLIRKSDIKNLGLQLHPVQVRLSRFGGGSVIVQHKVFINLKVDLALAFVEALVVPDAAQQVSLLIGQPSINHPNVTIVVRKEQVRLFNSDREPLNNIDNLPSRKITLWAKETTVIPPHHIEHILVSAAEDCDDVFIDLQHRPWPNKFHMFPRCITNIKRGGIIPILNIQ